MGKSRSEDLVNSFINIFLMNIAFWGGSHVSKGWVRVLARLQTISLQVSISGARLKMFYSQNLSQIKKIRERGARRMENPNKSCPNGLAQLCGLAQFHGLSKRSQPFFFWNKIEKKTHEPLRWVHAIETGT